MARGTEGLHHSMPLKWSVAFKVLKTSFQIRQNNQLIDTALLLFLSCKTNNMQHNPS